MRNPDFALYAVIIDPIITQYPYLMNELIDTVTLESGATVHQSICSEFSLHGAYFSATVHSQSSGLERKIHLRHSFVVAVFELVNQQTPPGFLR